MKADASRLRPDRSDPARPIETLARAIAGRDRLTIVTGDAGAGKTTLCLALASRFGPRNWGSLVLTPAVTPAALLRTILQDLGGVDPAGHVGPSEPQLATLLEYLRYASGGATVIVDSAHEMPAETLAIPVHAALAASREGVPLQVVLVGSPALDERLSDPALVDALREIDARHERLEPLDEADVKSFMERRWWHAAGGMGALTGAVRTPHLTPEAARAAFEASSGNPGTVAAIADHVWTGGPIPKSGRVEIAAMRVALRELGLAVAAPHVWKPVRAVAGIAAVGVVGIVAVTASRTFRQSSDAARGQNPASAAARVSTAVEREIADPSPLSAAVPPQQADGASTLPTDAAPALQTDAVSAPQASGHVDVTQDFATFRRTTLDKAAPLATAPDVRGMMRLEDDTKAWDAATNYTSHAAVTAFLIELERLTNEARERQLLADGRLLRAGRAQ